MSENTQIVEREQTAVAQPQEQQTAPRRTTVTPLVDILEDAGGVTLLADLPGVQKEQLDVKVHDGNLSIEAQAMVPTPPGLRLQYAEVREPRFARSFMLSPDFDTSKIEASLQDGVLTLRIPRRDEARPRRIEVTAG